MGGLGRCSRSFEKAPMQELTTQTCTKCGRAVATYLDGDDVRRFQSHAAQVNEY